MTEAVLQMNPRGGYRHAKSKRKSHYQFSNYVTDASGERTAEPLVGRHEDADLISTAIMNRAKGTVTIYGIPLDIDAGLTAPALLDSEGRVSLDKVLAMILDKIPWLMPRITYAVESYSGKGFGVLIWIAPVEKVYDNIKVLALGRAVQRRLIEILQALGIGADENASGLHRDMANWLNIEKRLYANEIERARVERDRVPVITDLLAQVNAYFTNQYIPKADRPDILYPDARAEKRFAELYLTLFDEHYQGKSHQECLRFSTSQDLHGFLGISKAVYYKILKSGGLEWLKLSSDDEGYHLVFRPEGKLTERARGIVEGRIKGDRVYKSHLNLAALIPEPCMVQDGDRNSFITRVAVEMKHCGVEEKEARAAIAIIAKQIPDAAQSWSVRNAARICTSIYRNLPELREVRSGEPLPEFIEKALRHQQPIAPKKRPGSRQKGLSIRRGRPQVSPGFTPRNPSLSNGWVDEGGVTGVLGSTAGADRLLSCLVGPGDAPSRAKAGVSTREFQAALFASRVSADMKKQILADVLVSPEVDRPHVMAKWVQVLTGGQP
jgi:hypothetical protein